MIKIIRTGKDENSLSLPLCRCLSENGGLVHFNGESFTQSDIENPEFLFVEATSIEYIHARNAIILLEGSSGTSFFGSDRLLMLIDYMLKDKIASENGIVIITCGISEKNAVSVSSINEDSALIAINEPISTVSGGEIYPCEISVALTHPIDAVNLIKIAAVLILSDKIQNERLII